MKWFRKVVDERQEQEMMRVERSAFYLLFFALALAVLVQLVLFEFDLARVAGECICLAVAAVWMIAGSIRHGAWDYFTKPGLKAYLVYSVLAGGISGTAQALMRYFRRGLPLAACLQAFLSGFVLCFLVVFAGCLVLGGVTKLRQKKIQHQYDDE